MSGRAAIATGGCMVWRARGAAQRWRCLLRSTGCCRPAAQHARPHKHGGRAPRSLALRGFRPQALGGGTMHHPHLPPPVLLSSAAEQGVWVSASPMPAAERKQTGQDQRRYVCITHISASFRANQASCLHLAAARELTGTTLLAEQECLDGWTSTSMGASKRLRIHNEISR